MKIITPKLHALSFLLGVLLATMILLGLMLFGFKFTYSPQLDNSWDAISAVGSWAGAISASAITLFIFIRQNQFEKRMFEKEQQISLFDLRYDCYKQFTAWEKNASVFKHYDTGNLNRKKACCKVFTSQTLAGICAIDGIKQLEDFLWVDARPVIKKQGDLIRKSEFCYDESISKLLLMFSKSYEQLLDNINESQDFELIDVLVDCLKLTVKEIEDNEVIKRMTNHLRLK